jgi:hypothetical protein
MLSMLTTLVLCFLPQLLLSSAQDPPPLVPRPMPHPDAWECGFNKYPEPQHDPNRCSQSVPSWQCDPNEILDSKQSMEVFRLLNTTYAAYRCLFGTDKCLPFGVAVVRKLKVLSPEEIPEKATCYGKQILSNWLESNGRYQGVVLFISWDDRMSYMSSNVNESRLQHCLTSLNTQDETSLNTPYSVKTDNYQYINQTISRLNSCLMVPDYDPGNTVTIVIAVIVSIIIIVGVSIAVIVFIKNKKEKEQKSDQHDTNVPLKST